MSGRGDGPTTIGPELGDLGLLLRAGGIFETPEGHDLIHRRRVLSAIESGRRRGSNGVAIGEYKRRDIFPLREKRWEEVWGGPVPVAGSIDGLIRGRIGRAIAAAIGEEEVGDFFAEGETGSFGCAIGNRAKRFREASLPLGDFMRRWVESFGHVIGCGGCGGGFRSIGSGVALNEVAIEVLLHGIGGVEHGGRDHGQVSSDPGGHAGDSAIGKRIVGSGGPDADDVEGGTIPILGQVAVSNEEWIRFSAAEIVGCSNFYDVGTERNIERHLIVAVGIGDGFEWGVGIVL